MLGEVEGKKKQYIIYMGERGGGGGVAVAGLCMVVGDRGI